VSANNNKISLTPIVNKKGEKKKSEKDNVEEKDKPKHQAGEVLSMRKMKLERQLNYQSRRLLGRRKQELRKFKLQAKSRSQQQEMIRMRVNSTLDRILRNLQRIKPLQVT